MTIVVTERSEMENEVNDVKYPEGGYGGYPGGGFGGWYGGGYPGGGYCRYGCCRRNYFGGCYRCCYPQR